MVRINTARSFVGLAVLLLCTLWSLALIARLDGPVSALASSPLSPLPTPPVQPTPEPAPVPLWPRILGVGLVSVGAILVVVGLIWLLRPR
jgi:hypothetical protein